MIADTVVLTIKLFIVFFFLIVKIDMFIYLFEDACIYV